MGLGMAVWQRTSEQAWQGLGMAYLITAVCMRGHLQQVDGLHESAVGYIDGWLALLLQVVAQVDQDVHHAVW